MAVIRVEKTKNYTVMSNYHLREKKMSLKAKGLLSLMLSLPQDWDYSIKGLVSICKEKELAIKNTLDELKTFGYLHIEKVYPNKENNGRIEYIYTVYECPKNENVEKSAKTYEKEEIQEGGFQPLDNQPLENQDLENQVQLNKDKQNTKELNKEEEEIFGEETSPEPNCIRYKEIIDFLNEKTNSKYKYTTKSTQRLINARLNEKFTVDDFKIVIAKKAREWGKDPVMHKYLRPETLFSASHFESYLNEKEKPIHSEQNDFEQRKNQFADIIRKNRERVE